MNRYSDPRLTARGLLVAAACVAATTAWAGGLQGSGPSATPGGFYSECAAGHVTCRARGGRVGTLEQLRRVNDAVNSEVQPVHSMSWDPRGTSGDCKTYAMRKYARLIAGGWPTSAVRLAERGYGGVSDHIVVVATVSGTDYVLDNLRSDIVTVDQAGYNWMRVQSRTDPLKWEAL